ncbi:RNA polymerase sigma factor [Rhodoferax sediminis]|jgi:RNA polymerase sigma-70 factor (ECF subfamily)|uniref:RNA polymerase sigma factor n=1 Tax=Rhodoferax sediminis TaxID=2509614 RepID=A0A515D7E3_9BURK|nr:RNA polymerase sigma factor [Rhodoferax sediminis]QDL36332.1 RNA polymerase sigma factor [Rhodoferax sediminis]
MNSIAEKRIEKDLPDAEMARRIAAGDRDALRQLMRRYNQTLYRTARSILKDDAEAEDAVQEAYILAYRAMGGFRGDAKLSTWLVRIVVNESIGRARKRSRRAEVIQLNGSMEQNDDAAEVPMNEASSEQPERAAMRAEMRRLLEAKIDQLPDGFRTVFVLRALEEMSVDEAAVCLGIPPATVRTRYFRAKGLLREALAREIDFSFGDAFAFAGERCDRIVAGVLTRLKNLPLLSDSGG